MPEAVTEREKELIAAVEAFERGTAELRQAEQGAKDARGRDTEAATTSVKAGKAAPKATEPQKREQLERTQRTYQALRREADQALAERDRAIRHADEWPEAQVEIVGEALAEVDRLVDELQAAYSRLLEQGGVVDAIAARRAGYRLAPNPARWGQRRVFLQHGTETRPDGSRRQLSKPIDPEPVKLIEALRVCAHELVPEPPDESSDEERRKAEDFEETRKAWRDMSKGGVFVPSAPIE